VGSIELWVGIYKTFSIYRKKLFTREKKTFYECNEVAVYTSSVKTMLNNKQQTLAINRIYIAL